SAVGGLASPDHTRTRPPRGTVSSVAGRRCGRVQAELNKSWQDATTPIADQYALLNGISAFEDIP
ncbi:MAG: hypothetical protein AAGC70_21140, partial [Pseudomonadota bacterium]